MAIKPLSYLVDDDVKVEWEDEIGDVLRLTYENEIVLVNHTSIPDLIKVLTAMHTEGELAR